VRRSGWWAAGTLALLGAAALIVPALAQSDPLAIDDMIGARLLPPLATSADGDLHLLGTDRFGRDLLVRVLLAARISLLVGILGSLLASALGVGIGVVSGWARGMTDRVLMSISDAALSIPRLILLLLCVALWRPGLLTVLVVLTATGWMSVARLVRSEVLGLRERAFVDAARTLGTPRGRILWKHIVPNALGPALVATTLGVGNAILLESGLAFLGLGVQPPTPSWGNMIAGGRDLIVTAPWVALVPGVFLVICVLACTALGDTARDRVAGESDLSEPATLRG
jgi:peptide/nickel transport system permease protein